MFYYDKLSLSNLTDIELNTTSEFLDSATITVNGSEVIIDCTFAAVYLDASCVLVYREYDNPILNVITYYKQNTSFPVSITIDNTEGKIYTFAIFGRDGSTNIDRIPLTSTRVEFETTTSMIVPTPSETVTPTHGMSLTSYVYVDVIITVYRHHNSIIICRGHCCSHCCSDDNYNDSDSYTDSDCLYCVQEETKKEGVFPTQHNYNNKYYIFSYCSVSFQRLVILTVIIQSTLNLI